MLCPRCRNHKLVVVDMRVGTEPVRMLSCSTCDSRWWEGIDGSMDLHKVLELASRS